MDMSGLLEGYDHLTIRVCVSVLHVRLQQPIVVCESEDIRRCQLGHSDVPIGMKCEINSMGCDWNQW